MSYGWILKCICQAIVLAVLNIKVITFITKIITKGHSTPLTYKALIGHWHLKGNRKFMYSGLHNTYLINAHCALIYFHEKSCPVRPQSIVVSSTITALCIFLFFEKYPALCAYSILCKNSVGYPLKNFLRYITSLQLKI